MLLWLSRHGGIPEVMDSCRKQLDSREDNAYQPCCYEMVRTVGSTGHGTKCIHTDFAVGCYQVFCISCMETFRLSSQVAHHGLQCIGADKYSANHNDLCSSTCPRIMTMQMVIIYPCFFQTLSVGTVFLIPYADAYSTSLCHF